MRNLKVLGLALVAMLALSAFGAAAASADDFTAEAGSVVLKGAKDPETTDQFLTTAGTVTCSTPSYSGTTTAPTTSVSALASYTGCTTSGLPTTIHMNGCTYKFNVPGGTSTSGDVDLVCSGSNEVTVTVSPSGSATLRCTLHIKGQNDIGGTVTYTNIGAGATREVTVAVALSGIDYTHTAGSGLGACTTGSATNGTLNAKAVVTGEVDPSGGHVGLFLSNV